MQSVHPEESECHQLVRFPDISLPSDVSALSHLSPAPVLQHPPSILHPSHTNGVLSGFPIQNPVCISLLPIRATCPTHLALLYLTTLITFRLQYKSWCVALCTCLQFPVTSRPLRPNIFTSTLFSNTPCLTLTEMTDRSVTP
jgi:hypothetical protein